MIQSSKGRSDRNLSRLTLSLPASLPVHFLSSGTTCCTGWIRTDCKLARCDAIEHCSLCSNLLPNSAQVAQLLKLPVFQRSVQLQFAYGTFRPQMLFHRPTGDWIAVLLLEKELELVLSVDHFSPLLPCLLGASVLSRPWLRLSRDLPSCFRRPHTYSDHTSLELHHCSTPLPLVLERAGGEVFC